MSKRLALTVAVTGVSLFLPVRGAAGESAKDILEATGIKGGLIVHLGCRNGKLTAALRANDSYLVHGLDADAKNVAKAREHIQSLGLYGKVSVEQWADSRLPYSENLVNLVVSADLGKVSMAECIRVLVPNGVAYIKQAQPGKAVPQWSKTVKPRPGTIDEWTHNCHGPDGNPVADDTVVGPPKHLQWIAGPLWLRCHDTDSSVMCVVTAGGRIVYLVDEAPISLPGQHDLPDKWSIAARDAFSGVLLWKRPIRQWGWRQWKPYWFKRRPGNFPLNVHRRVVAVGESVYATLGYHAPVSRLDAATGQILQTYEGTDKTREILCHDGRLILTVQEGEKLKLMALEAETGEVLWQTKERYGGITTDYNVWDKRMPKVKIEPVVNAATDGRVVCLLNGKEVVCLDYKTGKQRWRSAVRTKHRTLWVGTLILSDGVVLQAEPEQLTALSAQTGKQLWTRPKRPIGWLWFQWKDVFVIRGLVWTWSAELERKTYTQGKRRGRSAWPVSVNGYDLKTGKLKRQVPLGHIFTAHHHHRCYPNKATARYILASRRGTEFVDLLEGKHTVHNWVRGTCHLGMMPANGLHYVPPHPCRCYINEKLSGFLALAPERKAKAPRKKADRLRRGPAYVDADPQSAIRNPQSGDWPTYRHDAIRSGFTKSPVPAKLKPAWQTRVGGPPTRLRASKLSTVTVAGGKVFVAQIDAHTVHAIDARNGKPLWSYTVGGRVDSPPTIWQGRVLFGSADGWVYCLRASDGRLAWRFRAAPQQRRIGAFGQIESAWPVHGSVLVRNGLVYCAAGRSSYLDGGIYLWALDAATGQVKHQARLIGPETDFSDGTAHFRYDAGPGALNDVLQADEECIYLRNHAFDFALRRKKGSEQRIRALGGFLDDTYFRRAFWYYGSAANRGRIIVHDGDTPYITRMFRSMKLLNPNNFFTPGKDRYQLIAAGRAGWHKDIAVRVRAMVATKNVLFIAGPPDVMDAKDPLGAFEGRKGALLWAVSTADGKKLAEYKLDSPPVFDALAAANGRLYISTVNGKVLCMGGK